MTGFMLYAACAAIVAAVAGKKGLRWWVYLLAVLVLGPATVMATSIATQGTASGFAAASLAFMVPLVALLIALFSNNDKEIAADNGQYGPSRTSLVLRVVFSSTWSVRS